MSTCWQQKADFWLRLNFTSPCSGFSNHTFPLVSCCNWNLSCWILFTENCHCSEVLSKSPSMENSYKAGLFSVRNLKVSSDKAEWFSSIVDEIPPMPEWSAATRKEEDLWSVPKRQPRYTFQGRVFSQAALKNTTKRSDHCQLDSYLISSTSCKVETSIPYLS